MTTLPRILSTFAFMLLGCSAVHAHTVWRCDGNSYSSQPCASGKALDLADARSAEQVRAARDVAQSDRRLAQQMAQDRHAQERETRMATGSGLTGFKAAALTATTAQQAKPQRAPKKPAPKSAVRKARSGAAPSGAGI
jgi:hypothetical protein